MSKRFAWISFNNMSCNEFFRCVVVDIICNKLSAFVRINIPVNFELIVVSSHLPSVMFSLYCGINCIKK